MNSSIVILVAEVKEGALLGKNTALRKSTTFPVVDALNPSVNKSPNLSFDTTLSPS